MVRVVRCFLAIDLNDKIKERISSILPNMDGIKKVERDNLHLTLRFFGEKKDKEVDEIVKKLKQVRANKFFIHINGIGAFPNPSYIRVLWVGIVDGQNEVRDLINKINNALGLSGEKFEAHVTIARVKKKPSSELLKIMDKNKNIDVGKQLVEKFVLKKSTLTPKGPVYEDIAVFELE